MNALPPTASPLVLGLSPVVAIHTCFALCAVLLGPVALWARLGQHPHPHPRVHRAFGYAWVTCMLGTALSALFIPSTLRWQVAGFGPIHLLILLVLFGLFGAIRAIVQGRVRAHRLIMVHVYVWACMVTGLFTLLPNRLLGRWLSGLLLGLVATGAVQAQTGWRELDVQGMTVVVSYPSNERNRTHMHGAFALQVAKNAALKAPAQGQAWPLIVMSHGTGGSSEPHHGLTTALVQAGFVVAEPLHPGDTSRDTSRAGPESWKTRPQEVSQTIDAMAKDVMFQTRVRTDRVGVHGMSAGGVTGLALAGGQWRLLNLVQHCAEQLDADVGFCLNGAAQDSAQQDKRRHQFSQAKMLQAIPEALLPKDMTLLHGGQAATDPRPDSRIAAVSLLVPVGAIFSAESLARIRIPVGITVAERDEVLLPRFHSRHVLAHCKSCQLLSSHPQAGHFDWFDPWPETVARSVAAQQIRGGMPHPDFSATERARGYAQIVRFFKQTLQ